MTVNTGHVREAPSIMAFRMGGMAVVAGCVYPKEAGSELLLLWDAVPAAVDAPGVCVPFTSAGDHVAQVNIPKGTGGVVFRCNVAARLWFMVVYPVLESA